MVVAFDGSQESIRVLGWLPLALLVELLPDAVIVVRGGTIVYASPRIEELAGYPPDELEGRPLQVLIPEALHAQHEEHRRRYQQQPSTRPMGTGLDTRIRHRDGTVAPVDISLAPLFHDGQQAVVAVIRDATAQRRREEHLRAAVARADEASRRLRASDDTKNVFLRALSHDVRSPLTVIAGVAQTLAARPDAFSDAGARDLMRRVLRQVGRIERMLDDLLDLERLTSMVQLERQPTDAAGLVAALVAEVTDRPVRLDLDPSIVAVDPVAIGRIVTNLVRNAAQHTPEGTDIAVRSRVSGGELELVVEDRGPGIPDRLKASLLGGAPGDPLRLASGHGLGLSIVRGFAALHGGDLRIEDTPGGGARFVVRLPVPDAVTTPRVVVTGREAP